MQAAPSVASAASGLNSPWQVWILHSACVEKDEWWSQNLWFLPTFYLLSASFPLKMYFHLWDTPSLYIVPIINCSSYGSGITFMLTRSAHQEVFGMPKTPVLGANVKSFTGYKKEIFRWHSLLTIPSHLLHLLKNAKFHRWSVSNKFHKGNVFQICFCGYLPDGHLIIKNKSIVISS